MPAEPAVSAVAHVIQLSVAPVFLLSGIGGMLAVMAARLSRIVDRARVVEDLEAADPDGSAEAHAELRSLSRRAKIISRAIGLCTVTALLICTVIAILFLSAFVSLNASTVVALLFVAAMIAFIAALIMFLREVLIATAGLRFGRRALIAAPATTTAADREKLDRINRIPQD
jgi:hypothetical protein